MKAIRSACTVLWFTLKNRACKCFMYLKDKVNKIKAIFKNRKQAGIKFML